MLSRTNDNYPATSPYGLMLAVDDTSQFENATDGFSAKCDVLEKIADTASDIGGIQGTFLDGPSDKEKLLQTAEIGRAAIAAMDAKDMDSTVELAFTFGRLWRQLLIRYDPQL